MYKGFYSYGITFQKNIETIETSLSTDYKILLFSQFPDHARNSFLSTLQFFFVTNKKYIKYGQRNTNTKEEQGILPKIQ